MMTPKDPFLASEVGLSGPNRPLELPQLLVGHESPVVRRKLERFFHSVAEMFEAWVFRSDNPTPSAATDGT